MKIKQFTISTTRLDHCKTLFQDEAFIKKAFNNSVNSFDGNALSAIIKNAPNIKSVISMEGVFDSLVELVQNDKYLNIVKILINELNSDFVNYKNKHNDTLLSFAAAAGSNKIVDYLLSKDSNINNKNIRSYTPIMLAVQDSKIDTVKLLIKKNANVNLPGPQNATALHLAAFVQDNAIEELLKKEGKADTRLKCNVDGCDKKYNYFEFKTLLKNNPEMIPQIPQVPKVDVTKWTSSFSKGVANFCKAITVETNNAKFLLEAINLFKKYITDNKSNLQNQKYVQESLQFLITLYELYKYEDSEKLREYLIKNLHAFNMCESLATLYNLLSEENISKADYLTGADMAQLALDKCNLINKNTASADDINFAELKYKIFLNLGICMRDLNMEKSLGWFEKAALIFPQNLELIVELIAIYLRQSNIEQALKEVEQVSDPDLKDLLLLNTFAVSRTQTLNEMELLLKKYNFERFSDGTILKRLFKENEIVEDLYFMLQLEMLLFRKNYDEAINQLHDRFNKFSVIEGSIIIDVVWKLLQVYQTAGRYGDGIKFLEKFTVEYPEIAKNNNSPLFKFEAFRLYEQIGGKEKANEYFEFLLSHAHMGSSSAKLLAAAKKILLYTEIIRENFLAAYKMLEKHEDTYNASFFSSIIKQLQQSKSDEQNVFPSPTVRNPEEHTGKESFAALDWLEDTQNTENLEEVIASFNPKLIHRYFQQKKQKLLKEEASTIIKHQHEPILSWNCGRETYSSKDKGVYKVEGNENFYAVISLNILTQLDKVQTEQFENALSKGIVSHHQGKNGIKYILHKLIELKINEDARLYTTKLYLNDGKYLIVFDKIANHTQISKLLRDSKIKIISAVNLQESDQIGDLNNVNGICAGIDNCDDSGVSVIGNNTSDEG